MDTLAATSPGDLDTTARQYIYRLDQIDRILRGPVEALVRVARENAARDAGAGPDCPIWITQDALPDPQRSLFAGSLSLVTLHRLYGIRRRFPGLKALKELDREQDDTLADLSNRYTPDQKALGGGYFRACCELIDSRAFGFLNPITAAQTFRVLMESGEDHAHTGIGCLAFFAMVWPLYRQTEDPLDIGARVEPSHASAYVTAKCLLPLIDLRHICHRRARLFRKLDANLAKLRKIVGAADRSAHHQASFCVEIEDLRKNMRDMALISIDGKSFERAEVEVARAFELLGKRKPARDVYDQTVSSLLGVMHGVRSRSKELMRDAQFVLKQLDAKLVQKLEAGSVPVLEGKTFKFGRQGTSAPPSPEHAKQLGAAARLTLTLCNDIVAQLDLASHLDLEDPAQRPEPEDSAKSPEPEDAAKSTEDVISAAFGAMAGVNEAVAELVSKPVDLQARWCHTVVNREIAYASADNFSDFDPAELVSAIAVSVRTHRLSTAPQVADAIKKALRGVQPDGSWRLGHPYFSPDGAHGIRPQAADVVWTLASALSHFPEIRVADDALFQFVDWLERTQRRLTPTEGTRAPTTASVVRAATDGRAPARGAHHEGVSVGWSVDQMRLSERINLVTTAYSVNALLAIRDLVEHRLWELCAARFTVLHDNMKLRDMDPVDLAAPAPMRLHSRLARMVREAQAGRKDADYSLVLHGPPGSSKTAVACALSQAMWSGSHRWGPEDNRLVRITPADFTRMGEDSVDSEAQLIFRLLNRLRGVTILFDEIDDFLRRRTSDAPRFLDLVIPAMLNRLQDLRDVCERQEICFLFGTNYVERIEPALMRAGRIDAKIPVTYPDHPSRMAMAQRHLGEAPVPVARGVDAAAWRARWEAALTDACETIARESAGWPWSAVTAACKHVRDSIRDAVLAWNEDNGGSTTAEDLLAEVARSAAAHLDLHRPDTQATASYLERLKENPSPEFHLEVLYHLVSLAGESDTERRCESVNRWLGGEMAPFRGPLSLAAAKLPHKLKLTFPDADGASKSA